MIEACFRYVRERYQTDGEVPSVRQLLADLKLSRARFYSMFPGGLDELCRKLGLPIPERRLKATEKASLARRSTKKGLEEILLGPCPTCGEFVRASEALKHMRHERVVEKPMVVEKFVEKVVEKPVAIGEVQRIIERPVERIVREVVRQKMRPEEFDELVEGIEASEETRKTLVKLKEELLRRGWLG